MSQILDVQYDVGGYYILDIQEGGTFTPAFNIVISQANNTVTADATAGPVVRLSAISIAQANNTVTVAMGTNVIVNLLASASFAQASNTVAVGANVLRPTIVVPSFVSVVKGANAVVTITLSTPTTLTSYARVTVSNGTKVGGVDFATTITNGMLSSGVTVNSGTLTIPPGVSSFTISIPTY